MSATLNDILFPVFLFVVYFCGVSLFIYNPESTEPVLGSIPINEELVAMIFSFLETMRLQGKNAVEELFQLLVGERYPPKTDFVLSI